MSPSDFEFVARLIYSWKLEESNSFILVQAMRQLYGPPDADLKSYPAAYLQSGVSVCLHCGSHHSAGFAHVTHYCPNCKFLSFYPKYSDRYVKLYDTLLFVANVLTVARPWVEEVTVRLIAGDKI